MNVEARTIEEGCGKLKLKVGHHSIGFAVRASDSSSRYLELQMMNY